MPDERADLLADLQLGQPLGVNRPRARGRPPGCRDRSSSACFLGIARRAWTGSTPSCCAAQSTAALVQPSNTAFSPTARARRRRNCSSGLGDPCPSTGLLVQASQAPFRQTHEHQRCCRSQGRRSSRAAAASRHKRDSRPRRRWPAGSEAPSPRSTAGRGRYRRLAGPARSLGSPGPEAGHSVQSAGMIRSPNASETGRSIAAPNRLDRNSSGIGFSEPRPAAQR